MTADIAAFILRQLAAEESAARAVVEAAGAAVWTYAPGDTWHLDGIEHDVVRQAGDDLSEVAFTFEHEAAHIARQDPAATLVRCAALRRIVARYEQAERLVAANAEAHAEASHGGIANHEQINALRTHGWELAGRRDGLLYAVTALASAWAGADGWDERWRA